MSDLQKYISQRKQIDPEFAKKLDEGYQTFKIGRLLRQAREIAGLTQEEVANKLQTKKSAISRMENHPEDMSLSTLGKLAGVLGKKIEIILYSAK
jgi:HTH-type transcriptional regulator/antitoxin HipB